ncbi:3716_t:CDS:2, partial [Racocetra fulgida]
ITLILINRDFVKLETYYLFLRYLSEFTKEVQDFLLRRIENLIGQLVELCYQAKANITKAQDKQKACHDQSHRIESYSIGDKVLLERSSLLTSYSAKFESKFTGPYYIHDVCGNGAYKLRKITNDKPGQKEKVSAPILKLLLKLQRSIRGSSVEVLSITNNTFEFLNDQRKQVQVSFAPDINKELIGNPMTRINKVESETWSQQMDYLCIRLQFCRLDRATLLRYYYQLGEKNRFTSGHFKNALKVARRAFALYHTRDAHNLLTTHHLSANALLVMSTENFNILLKEAWKGSQEEIVQILDLD